MSVLAIHYKPFSDKELDTTDAKELKELYRLYLKEHPHKKYAHDSDKGKIRFEHFKNNLHKIKTQREVNKKHKKHWHAGLNSMSDLSEKEFKGMNGHKEPPKETFKTSSKSFLQRNEKTHNAVNRTRKLKLPSYDWSADFSPSRDQGTCGDCWAWTTAAVMEWFNGKKNGLPSPFPYLSPYHVTTCANSAPNDGCSGGNSGVALKTFTINGIVPELVLPFNLSSYGDNSGPACTPPDTSNSFRNAGATGCTSGNYTVTTTYSNGTKVHKHKTKTCPDSGLLDLLANGPVAVTIDGTAIQHYIKGVFDSPCTTVDHAVTCVGYGVDSETGDEYWLIRNSWADTWGENGYIRVKRDPSNNDSCFIGRSYWQPTF